MCGAAQKNSVYRVGPPEPVFPGDFQLFAPAQSPSSTNWRCISVNDPVNSDLVGFNWCQSRHTRWLGWKFSPSGAKSGMDCIHMHTDTSQNFALKMRLNSLLHESDEEQALKLRQWEGEWLCVQKDEPLFLELDWFADSSKDRLPFDVSNCVNWGQNVGSDGEPEDHTQFLCEVPVEPRWPIDFRWSGEGKVSDFNCISVEEAAGLVNEGDTKDNFWCQRKGTRWLGWTFGPHLGDMQCVELSSTRKGWKNKEIFNFFHMLEGDGTYLCLYKDSPIGEHLTWHEDELLGVGGITKSQCVQWSEFNGADSTDNYVCGKSSISVSSNALKSMQMDCRAGTKRTCSCVDQEADKRLGRDATQGTLESFYNAYMTGYTAEQLVGTQECKAYLNYVSVWAEDCVCPSVHKKKEPAIGYRMAIASLLAIAACCMCNAMLACALFGSAITKTNMMEHMDRMDSNEEEVESMIAGSESKTQKPSTVGYLNEVAVSAVKEGASVARSIELAVTGN